MLREYELTLILDASLSPEESKGIYSKVQEIAAEHKGEVLQMVDLGKRDTSYEINDVKRGAYVYTNFVAEGTVVAALERWARYEDNVMRQLTLLLADEADVAARKAKLNENFTHLKKWFGQANLLAGSGELIVLASDEATEPVDAAVAATA